jgi:hypothetical protein
MDVETVVDDAELLNNEDDKLTIDELTDNVEPETEEPEEKEPEEKDEDKIKKIDEDKPFPYERPSISEIKAKYPEFFKDFPIFRDVVFREIEYTKVFPTIEDAKEANDDSIALSGLRDSVLAGKSEDIFDAINETDKKASERFAISFLPTLHKKDQALYSAAVTPLFENLCRHLYSSSDENTRNAALVAAQFLFGKDGEAIAAGEKTFAKKLEESEDEKNLKSEREKFQLEQYNGFRQNVLGDLGSQRRSLIVRGLDPQKVLTDTQKDMLVERIEKLVDQQLAADQSHMSIMNARWLRSKKEGFNTASKEKIVSAYLSRAKQIIPSIRDKERDAFLGTKKRAAEKKVEEIDNKSSKTKEITSGRSSSGKPEVLKPSKELYRKMSDFDILMQ